MTWDDLSDWWRVEIESDPAYEDVVTPLLLAILDPTPGMRYLDLGCGEGRVMRRLTGMGSTVHGVDLADTLVASAGTAVVGRIQELPIRADWYDGVYAVLTLEHMDDEGPFFSEAARVSKPGGVLALVANHPVWTAPDSTPILDTDGETLWRPGGYFSRGVSVMPAGEGSVPFHHRPMSTLLNSAAGAGWSLEHMIEQPHDELPDQAGIPRLLACRWTLGASRGD